MTPTTFRREKRTLRGVWGLQLGARRPLSPLTPSHPDSGPTGHLW